MSTTQINVLKRFTFTHPSGPKAGEKEVFEPGLRDIVAEFADHFFVKAHCGESFAADSDLRTQLEQAGAMLVDMRNALDSERLHANDLASQLTAAGDELAAERVRANDLAAQLADATAAVDAAAAQAKETETAMTALATANGDLTSQLAAAAKKK